MASSNVRVLDLSREYRLLKPLLLEAMESVLSQQRFVLGEEVGLFEKAAAAMCGAQDAIGCASGTDALWLALAGAGIGPGDAVITTPFSFFASVSCILRAGARPILADIDPRTFNLSPDACRRSLDSADSAEIRAILPVHLFGQTVDWDGFVKIQNERASAPAGLILIEDAAQAFGAQWKSRPAGSLGDAAAFSFYPTKNLSASGDGGMVTTSRVEIAERIRMLRAHGMRQRYYHEEVGWNSRLDTLQAAILLVKLRFIEEWNEQRRALAANYAHLFEITGLVDSGPYPDRGVVLPTTQPGATPVFHQYVIRVQRRDEMRAFLDRNGVGTEVYYPLPLHLQPALRSLGYAAGSFPESERAAKEVLALPMYPQLTMEEQETVVARFAEFMS